MAKLIFIWYYNFGENRTPPPPLNRKGMAAIPKIDTKKWSSWEDRLKNVETETIRTNLK